MPTHIEEMRTRKLLGFLAAGYAIFIVYGSLLPFNFEMRSLEEILTVLLAHNRNSILVSLTDRATNIFLSIPLAFLALGAATETGHPVKNLIAAIFVSLGCIALAVAVETLQALTPQRVASIADIIAQTIGGLIGVLLWAGFGKPFLRIAQWLVQTEGVYKDVTTVPPTIVWFVTVPYLIVLLVFNGWLTSRWTSFDFAWETAKSISYLPFFYHYSANIFIATSSAFKCLLLYAPIGIIYWNFSRLDSDGAEIHHLSRAALLAAAVSLVIETGKLFLAPKHPDVTNVLLAACASAMSFRFLPRIVFKERLPSQPAAMKIEARNVDNPAPRELSFRLLGFRVAAIISFCATALGVFFFPLGSLWLPSA